MAAHTFDPSIAKRVGLNAAVIFQNIVFWVEKNEATGDPQHFHENRWWTYNSVKGFNQLFWYLTPDQVRRALEKLEAEGLIAVGNFNQSAYDRTKWYSVSRQIHSAKMPDESGEDARPIPDSKPDHKPDVTNGPAPSEPDLFQEESTEEQNDSIPHRESRDAARDAFARFWSAYPKCKRKTDKPICAAVFSNIVAGKAKGIPKTDPEAIIAGAEAYAASNPDPEFIPAPARWLRGARWEQHQPAPAADTSKPDELALIEAKAAASELRSNPPWIDRKSGRVEAQRERLWMAQVARVLVWEKNGCDPVAQDRDWGLKVDLTAHLDRLKAYGATGAPRNGHPAPDSMRAPACEGARV